MRLQSQRFFSSIVTTTKAELRTQVCPSRPVFHLAPQQLVSRTTQRKLLTGNVGFVPTMGGIHDAHLSLVKASVEENDNTVVSIYVNPRQFGPGEDFESYPRSLEKDIQLLDEAGVDVIFAPDYLYDDNHQTSVTPSKVVEERSEGKARPGFFSGVLTVCMKLFNLVQPTRAYFGQKDGVQQFVVRQMVSDLDLPIEVRVCDTLREADGLALSTRNQYMSTRQRERAPLFYKALKEAVKEKDVSAAFKKQIKEDGVFDVDYVAIEHGLLTAAVRFKGSKLRLLDNIKL